MSANSKEVLLGLKSLTANALDFKKILEHHNETFERLTTENDFVLKSSGIASVGLGKAKDREVILVSDSDKKYIIDNWNIFFSKVKEELIKKGTPLPTQKDITLILNYIRLFNFYCCYDSKRQISNEAFVKKMIKQYSEIENLISVKSDDNGNAPKVKSENNLRIAIHLSWFITEKCGICRHASLINAIVVSYLVQIGLLPFGAVRQFRTDTETYFGKEIEKSSHAVCCYISENKIWIIDYAISAFYLVPLNITISAPLPDSNEKSALKFKKLVGEKFYSEMFDRLLPGRRSSNVPHQSTDNSNGEINKTLQVMNEWLSLPEPAKLNIEQEKVLWSWNRKLIDEERNRHFIENYNKQFPNAERNGYGPCAIVPASVG